MTLPRPTFSPSRLLLFNLLGGLLIVSWMYPALHFWDELDDAVFFLTNAWLEDVNTLWVTIVAATNHRLFDVFSLLVLLGLFLWAIGRDPEPGLRHRLLRWGGIGITMLLVAAFTAQSVRMVVDYSHPSPTVVYDGASLVSEMVDFSTKDSSGASFPGDHGVNLFLFTAFMWRFAGTKVMLASLAAAVLLSAPRILSGAHWFSDVYFGALAINLLVAPWFLLTPLGPAMARGISRGLAGAQARLLPGR